MLKIYKLLTPSGEHVESKIPGGLGGNSKAKIYGKLECHAANRALKDGYAKHRVFFADEQTAIDCGYRPCGACMRKAYGEWKRRTMTSYEMFTVDKDGVPCDTALHDEILNSITPEAAEEERLEAIERGISLGMSREMAEFAYQKDTT
jgi:hypothetical protein